MARRLGLEDPACASKATPGFAVGLAATWLDSPLDRRRVAP